MKSWYRYLLIALALTLPFYGNAFAAVSDCSAMPYSPLNNMQHAQSCCAEHVQNNHQLCEHHQQFSTGKSSGIAQADCGCQCNAAFPCAFAVFAVSKNFVIDAEFISLQIIKPHSIVAAFWRPPRIG